MGWFSTKKKTEVYTSATRMIEDKDLVNSNKAAVTEYLLGSSLQTVTSLKDMTIVDYMIQATQNSAPSKWKRAYAEAERGQYYYGLPTSNLSLRESTSFKAELVSLLNSIAGTPVTVLYGYADEMNYQHVTWQKLSSQFGYVPETNELKVISEQKGTPVYLYDFELVFPSSFVDDVTDEDYFLQWGFAATHGQTQSRARDETRTHSYPVEDVNATAPYARAKYTYRVGSTDYVEDLLLSFSEYDNTDDFIMACYSYAGKIRYFTGKLGTGEYPTIEATFNSTASFGKFYPRMYARLNKTNLAADSLKDTEAYKSSQKFWKTLDLDWAEWTKELHTSLEGSGDVAQAYVQCTVPANTTDPDVIEYLYKFFMKLYNSRPAAKFDPSTTGFYKSKTLEDINAPSRSGASIVIKDNAYTQSVSFSGIGLRDVVGSIGPVGSYKMERVTSFGQLSGSSFFSKLRSIGKPSHCYRYQITENTYREVAVYGLSVSEYVQGGYLTNSSGNSETLLIPMDYSMASEMSVRDFEQVMLKSLHIIVNTVVVTKTKWYQRGAFKVIMFIAAVVIGVFTGGMGFSLYAVLIAVANAVALTIVVSLVTKLAVKLGISIEIVAAIAVVAALVTGYVQFTKAAEIAGMSARTVMMVSNVALGVQSKMRMLEIQSIQQAFKNMEEDFKGRMEELEAIESDFWDDRQILDNMMWVQPNTNQVFINLGESPDDYYTRTIHTGNVGVAVLDITLNSVQNMLKLPTPSHTFEMLQGGSL